MRLRLVDGFYVGADGERWLLALPRQGREQAEEIVRKVQGKRPSEHISWAIECLKTSSALEDWAPRVSACLCQIAELLRGGNGAAFALDSAKRYALRKQGPKRNVEAEAFFAALEAAVAARQAVLDRMGAATRDFMTLLEQHIERVQANADADADAAYSEGEARKRSAATVCVGERVAKRQAVAAGDAEEQPSEAAEELEARIAEAVARAMRALTPAPEVERPPDRTPLALAIAELCSRDWDEWDAWDAWLAAQDGEPSAAAWAARQAEMDATLEARIAELEAAGAVLQLSESESSEPSEPSADAPPTAEAADARRELGEKRQARGDKKELPRYRRNADKRAAPRGGCARCHATETFFWRDDLCNKCYVQDMRSRPPPSGCCARCAATNAPRWYASLCNRCYNARERAKRAARAASLDCLRASVK